MSRLGDTLKEQMPLDRVLAKCGECGIELFDSEKSDEGSPKIVGNIIEMEARAHRSKTGHDDLEVGIDKPPTVEPMECHVTVNTK